MISDLMPPHWPKMLAKARLDDERSAIKALAEVRRLIVEYRKDDEWRCHHARTDHIINVVAGLIADAIAIDAHSLAEHRLIEPMREKMASLKEQLAESKRPFTAQMEMQNNRIIGLTAEVDRLRAMLDSRPRQWSG